MMPGGLFPRHHCPSPSSAESVCSDYAPMQLPRTGNLVIMDRWAASEFGRDVVTQRFKAMDTCLHDVDWTSL